MVCFVELVDRPGHDLDDETDPGDEAGSEPESES